jgi:hypothetical protein
MPQIIIDTVCVEVRYKRVKNFTLRVHRPDGHVSVSVPFFTATSHIKTFIRTKIRWIMAQQHAIKQAPALLPELPQIGGVVPLWGQAFVVQQTERGHAGVDWQHPYCFVGAHEPIQINQRLTQAYHRAVSAAVPALLAYWQPLIGVNVQRFFVRQMRSRWGSCTYRQHTIRLNSELAKYPPACLEYVVVHELVHLLEPSHNARFYALQSQFLPDFKARKLQLAQPPLATHPIEND